MKAKLPVKTELRTLKNGTKFISAEDGYMYVKVNERLSFMVSRDRPLTGGEFSHLDPRHPVYDYVSPPETDEWGEAT